MPLIRVYGLDEGGLAGDFDSSRMPPQFFTTALNVRVQDKSMEKLPGQTQVFGTPGVAPYFTTQIRDASNVFWVYASLTKIYGFDGTTHTDLTRTSGGDYNAASAADWNSCLLGGIPIINSGNDDPQFWAALALATPMADLSNWPANTTCAVLRSLQGILIALDVTESGTNYPHRVKWSAQAVPGSLPSSWDETDATIEAGEKDLQDTQSGIVMTGEELNGSMLVYKQNSVWSMDYIGGRFIFDFKTLSTTVGALTRRSVAAVRQGRAHVVATADDIVLHDRFNFESVFKDRRHARTLFRAISPDNYLQSFIFYNPQFREVWFCFPESGESVASRALIISEQTGALTEAEVDFQAAALGDVEEASVLWSASTTTWSSVSTSWNTFDRRKAILCDPANTKFELLDSGSTRDGTAFAGTLIRENLAVVGQDRQGQPIVDLQASKLITRLWVSASGGPLRVRMGWKEVKEAATMWTDYQTFTPGVDQYLDFELEGILYSLEISTEATDDTPFRLEGVEYELEIVGYL